MLTITEFMPTEEEYAALVAVYNGAWPDEPTTVASVKHGDSRWDPAYYYRRVVGRLGDRMVAVASVMQPFWSYRPGKYELNIDIHAEFEGEENRGQLYDLLVGGLETRDPAPVLLSTGAREDKPDQIRFLSERGFAPVMRFPNSRLQVDEFDFAPFAGLVERVEANGIATRTLAELMKSDPEYQRKMYDLDWAAGQDEPSPEPLTQVAFDVFARGFDAPDTLPEGIFMALDGDKYVGMSVLEKDLARPDHLNTGFTCTLPSHRRRNIALALKLKAIAFAKEYGAKTIDTGNEENNPMYQINLRLGFQPRPAWSDYHKKIE